MNICLVQTWLYLLIISNWIVYLVVFSNNLAKTLGFHIASIKEVYVCILINYFDKLHANGNFFFLHGHVYQSLLITVFSIGAVKHNRMAVHAGKNWQKYSITI